MKYILTLFITLIITGASWAQTFKVPPYQKVKLKNGLTVYLMEQHEVPLINVSAVFDAGAVQDGNRYGLASMTADALLFGSSKYTKAQLEEKIEYVGASVDTYAGKEVAKLSASFAVKDQDLLFDIIQDVLTKPTFDQGEFDKYKQRQLLQLTQQKESPRGVVGSYFNKFVFEGHPYANPLTGTPNSVSAISANDVRQFYQKNFTTDRAAIAIVGDFNTAAMKKRITDLFGTWKTAPATSPALTDPVVSFDKSRVLLVNKDDARETTFLIGGKGITQNNPDFIPVTVVNTILGGRFTSWLNDALRVNSGLTYGASSRFGTFRKSGTFAISTFTKVSTTTQAIDMAIQVLDSLHRTGIDEKTLSSAKNYVKADFPPRYESAAELANLLTDMFSLGFDESFINNFQKNVDGLTVARTRQIIDQYFPKDKLQFVLIGKAETIRDKVKKYGTITEKEIKAEGF
ncbi:M16 family metallopeptidase [Spirosoma fluviale]|uniref:Predicted Zn-dependent peptidase n=1 Tax=Spirosoma fluviale TaxID=1597977 RepID=A0A286GMR1_9BACT|nr:pitrilysin family protein [Spirosoma fluviale]SOD96274.1 Predicted Zn-dependent peptidase [Spirosoma fluviale]